MELRFDAGAQDSVFANTKKYGPLMHLVKNQTGQREGDCKRMSRQMYDILPLFRHVMTLSDT